MSEVKITSFLNVDLDLRAPTGLVRLVQALQPALLPLRVTERDAALELAQQPRDVGDAIDDIAVAVERLPADLRSLWDSCQTRTMNVGVAAGREPHEVLFAVPLTTLSRLTAIGADLAFTVYGSKRASPTTRRRKPRAVARRSGAKRKRRRSKR